MVAIRKQEKDNYLLLNAWRPIPLPSNILRELDRARTSESKIRIWSRKLDPINSIGWLLSITVGHILPGEGIALLSTVSKVIEAVIAEQIHCIVEEHNILPAY